MLVRLVNPSCSLQVRTTSATTLLVSSHINYGMGERPWHYKNVKAFLKSKYKWIERDWLEADDLIGIAMSKHPGKYICITRDKDLRMLPGHHYGWEVGKQPSYGPRLVDDIGFLQLSPCRKKITGGGLKFFYYQLLKGDSVDTIPGIPGFGVVTIFSLLGACQSESEMLEAVCAVYEKHYGVYWKERLIEVGRLLNMVREERNNYTEILLWNPFQETKEWMHVETGRLVARKIYNDGQWTQARFNSFIKGGLRSLSVKWPARYTCLNDAYRETKTNVKTGRMAKHFECNSCHEQFPQKRRGSKSHHPCYPS